MRIKSAARELVKKYKTRDPLEIAKKRGVLIYDKPLGNILGFFTTSRRVQIIYLNADLSDPMRRFVCAHELGHTVLHPGLNTPFLRQNTLFSVDKIEREANEFAVELLMSDEDLYELRDSCVTIYEAAGIYGVPPELAYLKNLQGGAPVTAQPYIYPKTSGIEQTARIACTQLV